MLGTSRVISQQIQDVNAAIEAKRVIETEDSFFQTHVALQIVLYLIGPTPARDKSNVVIRP